MTGRTRKPLPPADLPLLVQAIRDVERAERLARAAGWLVLLGGLVVVIMGATVGHGPSMIEGTVIALLALFAGWMRTPWLAIPLALLIGFGLVAAVFGGGGGPLIGFLALMFFAAVRLVEASLRFRS